MCSFTCQYKGAIYESNKEHYMHDGEDRYRVVLPDGLPVIIAKFGMGPPDKILWVESHKSLDEIIQPFDLVQAIGEGLEEYKLNRPD